MTSTAGGPWDQSWQEYKKHDPFCEPLLISILFLSCGKHKLTKVCLDSTRHAIERYSDQIEWLFMEQGGDEENYRLFMEFPAERKVVIRQQNYGINNGLNQLWALSRGEFCFIHESDWWMDLPQFDVFGHAKQILVERPSVGLVQCRAAWDPNENWGLRKPEFNPWSCPDEAEQAGYRVFEEETETGHKFRLCEFPNGFNNNPILMRKKLYRECGPYPEPVPYSDPRHGETEYAARVWKTGCVIAHIGKEVYRHVGGADRFRFEALA